jgi:lysophospholipase L1-like esterase
MNSEPHEHWVGTWACSAQRVEVDNLPPAPGISGNTLRQIVQVSIGGRRLRLRFSNAYGEADLTLSMVQLARSVAGSTIRKRSNKTLFFDGRQSLTLKPGASIASDPIDYDLEPLSRVTVTIHFAASPLAVTGHPGSRTTSFLAEGDQVVLESLPTAVRTEHWYILTGIDVWASRQHRALVTLGDSITDGRGSTTDGHDRWPDLLTLRLHGRPSTADVAVLNQGIGGNAVLEGGLGPSAIQRFERDVLEQPGVRFVILLEGVNDIGAGSDLDTVAERLIAAYEQFVHAAHDRNLLVYGVSILPFDGSQYSGERQERARRTVNDWVRNSGRFDAVLDLARAVCNPKQPERLLPLYDCGDHLHLSPAGYRCMAEAIDLRFFER